MDTALSTPSFLDKSLPEMIKIQTSDTSLQYWYSKLYCLPTNHRTVIYFDKETSCSLRINYVNKGKLDTATINPSIPYQLFTPSTV